MHTSCAFHVLRYPPALAVISMLMSLLLAELTFFCAYHKQKYKNAEQLQKCKAVHFWFLTTWNMLSFLNTIEPAVWYLPV